MKRTSASKHTKARAAELSFAIITPLAGHLLHRACLVARRAAFCALAVCALATSACYLEHERVDGAWTCTQTGDPPVLLATVANTISSIDRQGLSSTFFSFPAGYDVTTATAGPFVGAIANDGQFLHDGINSVHVEALVMCATGERLFHNTYQMQYEPGFGWESALGNRNGDFVLGHAVGSGYLLIHVGPSGEHVSTDAHVPQLDLGDDGITFTRNLAIPPDPLTLSWYDVYNERFSPVAYVPDSGLGELFVEGLASAAPGEAALRVERGNEIRRVALPGPPFSVSGVQLISSNEAGFMLFRDGDAGLRTANFKTGESNVIGDLVAPTGMVEATSGLLYNDSVNGWIPFPVDVTPAPQIDSAGRILAAFRTGTYMQLHRSRDGINWEPIGSRFTAVDWIYVLDIAGVYTIRAFDHDRGELPWESPVDSDVLVGDHAEVVRESSGIHASVSATQYSHCVARDDGEYVAWDAGGSIHFLNTQTGELTDADLDVPEGSRNLITFVGARTVLAF